METAAYAITANLFPDAISYMMGLLEARRGPAERPCARLELRRMHVIVFLVTSPPRVRWRAGWVS